MEIIGSDTNIGARKTGGVTPDFVGDQQEASGSLEKLLAAIPDSTENAEGVLAWCDQQKGFKWTDGLINSIPSFADDMLGALTWLETIAAARVPNTVWYRLDEQWRSPAVGSVVSSAIDAHMGQPGYYEGTALKFVEFVPRYISEEMQKLAAQQQGAMAGKKERRQHLNMGKSATLGLPESSPHSEPKQTADSDVRHQKGGEQTKREPTVDEKIKEALSKTSVRGRKRKQWSNKHYRPRR